MSSAIELIFHGTGTSSSVPQIDCLTAPPSEPRCETCFAAVEPNVELRKNARRNTGAIFRVTKDAKVVTIVVDVGKTFLGSALEWFPKYNLRKIDAVLITHAHADAMNGLDDLRGWTLSACIQSHIDIYCSAATFVEIKRSFPYLVSKEFASGGGDVPDFKFHIIEEYVPFTVQGIEITPFPVHHGRIFSTVNPPAYTPTPQTSGPSSPLLEPRSLANHAPLSMTPPSTPTMPSLATEKVHPYICFGYLLQDSVVYMSDVSEIPEETWNLFDSRKEKRAFDVAVLDCLRLKGHTSHFGIHANVQAARRIGARRTYAVGFSHDLPHTDYVRLGVCLEKGIRSEQEPRPLVREGLSMIEHGPSLWWRPSYDGLRVFIDAAKARIYDEGYERSGSENVREVGLGDGSVLGRILNA